ncbi:putative 2OG-Fe(II) oxygenase [Sphingomonas baiyangensis]|uniref:Tetratricopeptide repeat protein n=1 Tax=Sphingomonas baiyangensis TaxID=2572576 RepID=A0A4U1L350_9SPHN|nr:putative 2OG-Fe(II) oxygenase [Sphingomonas baiyangensis]TKD51331.1 tetratricopeptide repeat protein [Sphingomonas baiyangensis]
MRANDPATLFARAEQAFLAGRLEAARGDLLAALRLAGEHPAILHLLALLEKRAGQSEAARKAFARALRQAPDDPQIRTNHANLLLSLGDEEAALKELDRAIDARPGFRDAHVNRAVIRHRSGNATGAWRDIEAFAAAPGADARILTLAGQIRRDLGEFDAAATCFDRALALDPARATALAGRARVALERGDDDAEARHATARRAAPENIALRLGEALAAEAGGNAERGIALLREALHDAPLDTELHVELVRMASEAGYPHELDSIAAAAARPEASLPLHQAYVTALAQAERPQDVIEHVDRLAPAMRADALLSAQQLAAFDTLDMREHAAPLAERLANGPATVFVARHALRFGDPQRAASLLEARCLAGTGSVADWAHLGIAWRLLGDYRAAWLFDQPGLYRWTDLELSAEDLVGLAALLRGLHRTRAHPVDQSLRGGTQTRGSLFARREPALRALAAMLDTAIARHMAALPPADPAHPLLARRDAALRISGSWSVRLGASGFHVSHIHPQGLLSSALYIALPERIPADDDRAGWLELGRPPAELELDLPPVATIEPRPGRLALFPSYMFHGTRPFAAGERLTVAFDVALR